MNSLLLTGGRVIDPANRLDAVADLLILNGKIAAVGKDATTRAPGEIERFDAKGKIVCPGLIDLHVHLREPGQTAKENIATGTAAAARGGFTSVVCMPNTSPAIDNAGTVALIHELSGGIPRKINHLCDMSLFIGYTRNAGGITPDIVHEASGEISY